MAVDAHIESIVVDVFHEYPYGLSGHYVTGSPSEISFKETIVGKLRAEKMRQLSVVRLQELSQIVHYNIPDIIKNHEMKLRKGTSMVFKIICRLLLRIIVRFEKPVGLVQVVLVNIFQSFVRLPPQGAVWIFNWQTNRWDCGIYANN